MLYLYCCIIFHDVNQSTLIKKTTYEVPNIPKIICVSRKVISAMYYQTYTSPKLSLTFQTYVHYPENAIFFYMIHKKIRFFFKIRGKSNLCLPRKTAQENILTTIMFMYQRYLYLCYNYVQEGYENKLYLCLLSLHFLSDIALIILKDIKITGYFYRVLIINLAYSPLVFQYPVIFMDKIHN